MRKSLPALRPEVGRMFYEVCKFLSQLAAILLFDARARRPHRTPLAGGAFLAPNHVSFLDPWVAGLCAPRAAFYLARDTLFRIPVLGSLIARLNALPIPREGAASRRGIESARDVVNGGGLLVFFPEGTRSPDGRLAPLRRGLDLIARSVLARGGSAMVVPVFIDGTFQAWPRRRRLPRVHPVRVYFGRPFHPQGEEPAAGEGAETAGKEPAKKQRSCADLLPRLEASYRSLEAWAREVRRAGDAGRRRWLHEQGLLTNV